MGETDSSGCVLLTIFVQQRLHIWPIFSLQLWYIQIRPCAWLWLKECPTQGKLGKQSVSWTALDICSQNRKYSPKTWGSLKSPYTHIHYNSHSVHQHTFFSHSRDWKSLRFLEIGTGSDHFVQNVTSGWTLKSVQTSSWTQGTDVRVVSGKQILIHNSCWRLKCNLWNGAVLLLLIISTSTSHVDLWILKKKIPWDREINGELHSWGVW